MRPIPLVATLAALGCLTPSDEGGGKTSEGTTVPTTPTTPTSSTTFGTPLDWVESTGRTPGGGGHSTPPSYGDPWTYPDTGDTGRADTGNADTGTSDTGIVDSGV